MKKSACVWERKQWFPHAHISEADGPKIEGLFPCQSVSVYCSFCNVLWLLECN